MQRFRRALRGIVTGAILAAVLGAMGPCVVTQSQVHYAPGYGYVVKQTQYDESRKVTGIKYYVFDTYDEAAKFEKLNRTRNPASESVPNPKAHYSSDTENGKKITDTMFPVSGTYVPSSPATDRASGVVGGGRGPN